MNRFQRQSLYRLLNHIELHEMFREDVERLRPLLDSRRAQPGGIAPRIDQIAIPLDNPSERVQFLSPSPMNT